MASICEGWMLHMRRKREFLARAFGVGVNRLRIIEGQRDVVRRHHAIGQGGRYHFGLGARQERVLELAGTLHRRRADGALVGADEIHQAKIKTLYAGQRGNGEDLVQRAVGFDEYMQRDVALHPEPRALGLQSVECQGHIGHAPGLGQGDESQALARQLQEEAQFLAPNAAARGVDAHSDARVIRCDAYEFANPGGVADFVAQWRPILAVAGQIEYPAETALQLQSLLHSRKRAGVMHAGGQGG